MTDPSHHPSSSILPPSITLPVDLALNRSISPGALQTWVQLRLLALDGLETPALSLLQISEHTGKSRSTLYEHLADLKRLGVLRWRFVDFGMIVISFTVDPAGAPPEAKFVPPYRPASRSIYSRNPELGSRNLDSESGNLELDSGNLDSGSRNLELDSRNPESESGNLDLDSRNLDSESRNLDTPVKFTPGSRNLESESGNLDTPSLNYSLNNHHNNQEELRREGVFRKSGKSDRRRSRRDAARSVSTTPESPGDNPAQVYHAITGIHPNKIQRRQVNAEVADLALWQSTLEHWMSHRWNPRNLPGMLDLYAHGGVSACRSCHRASPSTPKTSVYERNLTLLDSYLQEPPDG